MEWWTDPANRSPVIQQVIGWVEQLSRYGSPRMRGSILSYLDWLVQDDKYLEKDDDTDNQPEEDDESSSPSIYFIDQVAKKLNTAAIFIFTEDYPSALYHLRQLLNLTKLQIPARNRKAVEMVRDSLFWTCGFLYQGVQISTVLEYNWALEVGGNDPLEALLDFMKACLGQEMGIPLKMILDYEHQALKTDSGCSTWYHYVYRSLRQVRRNKDKSGGPGDAEEEAAEAGYELSGGLSFVALTDYALYLKELLWPQNETQWEIQNEEYMAVTRFYEEAITLAKQVGCQTWADKVQVDLAEFLAFGKGQYLDHQLGKNMLDKLVVRDPYNYLVFQLAAKVYHKVVDNFDKQL